MGKSIKYIILGVLILLFQILISEYVNIWPMLYIVIFPVFIIILPCNMNTLFYMLIAFLFGLGVDSLSDGILGLNAAACVAIAYSRKSVLSLVLPKSSIENLDSVSSQDLGVKKMIVINLLLYSVFFLVYIGLDNFLSVPFIFTLLRFLLCTLLNIIFAIIFEV
ncbi:MAG: hypothetical protein RR880_05495, partial [Bacteroidales bacterium]